MRCRRRGRQGSRSGGRKRAEAVFGEERFLGGADVDGAVEERVVVPKSDRTQGEGDLGGAAVEVVAEDREVGGGEVDADLVGATGDGEGFDEGEPVAGFEGAKRGFGFLAVAGFDADAADALGIFFEFEMTGPLALARDAADDGEVALVHLAGFEQHAEALGGTGAAGKEEDAGGLGVQAVDEAEEPDVAGAGPESTGADGGLDGGLEVAVGLLPGEGHEHPAAGFVDREDRAVLVKDRDAFGVPAVTEFDIGRLSHARGETFRRGNAKRGAGQGAVGVARRAACTTGFWVGRRGWG